MRELLAAAEAMSRVLVENPTAPKVCNVRLFSEYQMRPAAQLQVTGGWSSGALVSVALWAKAFGRPVVFTSHETYVQVCTTTSVVTASGDVVWVEVWDHLDSEDREVLARHAGVSVVPGQPGAVVELTAARVLDAVAAAAEFAAARDEAVAR
ncbi:hypothetical protein [Actinokineospora iranica]|uniref:Uncharacterized protein n=1 Tax=Actinokineospora iranica TaxID=1271860 RepID=A0A1G6YWM2_9PSEU|nr:hypothetical protein [Actinokineospora iranica]SDD94740.1 hypothetical protein SAMN05216174_12412 [Actinokineospora iranica]